MSHLERLKNSPKEKLNIFDTANYKNVLDETFREDYQRFKVQFIFSAAKSYIF